MKPTHRLKAFNSKTEKSSMVGAGWLNKDGSISVQLDPFIKLHQKPDWHFTLFPIEKP